MIIFYFAILASWALFLTVWGVTYSQIQPHAKIAYDPENYVGIFITGILAVLLFFRGSIFGSSAHYYAFVKTHQIFPVFGLLLCVLGITFALWARIQSTRTLENQFPFSPAAYMSYPSYVGIFVAMVGSAIIGGMPWLLIALANTIYLMYRIGYAEGRLSSNLIEEWVIIKGHVKSLVPARLSRLIGRAL
ncbi:MAG TPA: hypothetical protein VG984_02310 [Candidatus Paceibacterota bacterium]|nr:hypothetical protein [Candidatus Paceibacterota bacterium]